MTASRSTNTYLTGFIAVLLLATNVNSDTSNGADVAATEIRLSHIEKMNARCLTHAREANYDIAIAIYDQGGILLSFTQADNAAPALGEVARWKAISAAYYRTATAETANWNVPNAPKIATVQGGLPIFSSAGKPLGGIGVSGAPAEFDEQCAGLAIEAAGLRS